MPGEEDYYRNPENILLTFTGINHEITIYVAGTGIEDANTKYLNKGSLATGLVIRPSATVELITLGSKTLRDPITITTAGLSWSHKIKDFNVLVLRATAAGTAEVILT